MIVDYSATFKDKELLDILSRLSAYGLGVCIPHAHNNDGEIVPLPHGVVALERAGRVRFVSANSLELTNARPVAWRSNGESIESVAYCCDGPDPDPDY